MNPAELPDADAEDWLTNLQAGRAIATRSSLVLFRRLNELYLDHQEDVPTETGLLVKRWVPKDLAWTSYYVEQDGQTWHIIEPVQGLPAGCYKPWEVHKAEATAAPS